MDAFALLTKLAKESVSTVLNKTLLGKEFVSFAMVG